MVTQLQRRSVVLFRWALSAAVALGLLERALPAQQAGPPDAEQMFRSLDANGDNRISLEDARGPNRAFLEQVLRMGGKGNDGSLTRAEFQQVFEAHRAGQRPGERPTEPPRPTPGVEPAPGGDSGLGPTLLRLCDVNGDGRLSRNEWNRFTQLFTQLDSDSNGSLDARELAGLSQLPGPAARTSAEPTSGRSTSSTAPTTPPPPATGRNAAGLDGVWRGWVVRGRGEDVNSGEMQVELTVRGTHIEAREIGTNRAPEGLGGGDYTIAGDGRSGTLDAVQTSGPQSGRNFIGVYERDGDTLRWCVTGRNRERPAAMATDRGNYLLVLRRQ